MSDKNYRAYGNQTGVTIADETLSPPEPLSYADILKYSHSIDCEAIRCDIAGGNEDCIDINNSSSNVRIIDCVLRVGGNQAVTIKGGSDMIILRNVIIHGRGKYAEIELGNWSDQSMRKTTRVVLDNVRHADGKPVRVVVGVADKPTIIGGNVKVRPMWSLFVKLYCKLKGMGLPI